MKLSKRDIHTLGEIAAANDMFARLNAKGCAGGYSKDGHAKPLDFGGSNGSHHSSTAQKLVRLGLVDRKWVGGYYRKTWAYKVTPTGIKALEETS